MRSEACKTEENGIGCRSNNVAPFEASMRTNVEIGPNKDLNQGISLAYFGMWCVVSYKSHRDPSKFGRFNFAQLCDRSVNFPFGAEFSAVVVTSFWACLAVVASHAHRTAHMTHSPVYQALENLRSVLVLLVPVGSISSEKFMKYAQHVSSCTSLALADYVDYSSTHIGRSFI